MSVGRLLLFSLPLLGVLLVSALWGSCANHGGVYYLDSINGNDANSGHSPQKAWKTLAKVNSTAFHGGDSLLLKCGSTFFGQLKPAVWGKSEKSFTISSYGKGEKPIVEGNGIVPAAVWLFNVQNIEVVGLKITNTGKDRQAGLAGIKVEIENFGTAKNIALRDLDISDVSGSLVKKAGGGSGILIQNGGDSVVSVFDGLLIEGCSIRRCERNGIIFGGYWSRKDWHPSLNVVIRKNLIEEVPGDGIVPIGCDGVLIEHNVMRNGTRLLPLGEAAAGIWPWSCDNTLVQYNEVSGHKAPWDGQGFDSDWNCRNTVIQYNYSHDNEGGFVLVCNDGSVGNAYSVGNTNTVIRYNISVNDGNRKHKTHSGVFSPVVHFAGPAVDTKFYNNLIIHAGEVADTLDNSLMNFSDWGGMPGATYFANNVFVTYTPSAIGLGGASNVNFSQNLFAGSFANMPSDNGNVSLPAGFEKWQVKGNAGDGFGYLERFRIDGTFPGIGKGKAIDDNAAKDFFGNAVNNDVVNIGVDQSKY